MITDSSKDYGTNTVLIIFDTPTVSFDMCTEVDQYCLANYGAYPVAIELHDGDARNCATATCKFE